MSQTVSAGYYKDTFGWKQWLERWHYDHPQEKSVTFVTYRDQKIKFLEGAKSANYVTSDEGDGSCMVMAAHYDSDDEKEVKTANIRVTFS